MYGRDCDEDLRMYENKVFCHSFLEMRSLWSETEVLRVGPHYQELLWKEPKLGYDMTQQTKVKFDIRSTDG